MKLSELRGAIRSAKRINPAIEVELTPGHREWLPLQKTPFLDALGAAFDDSRTAETGIEFDPETGHLTFGTDSNAEDHDPLDDDAVPAHDPLFDDL